MIASVACFAALDTTTKLAGMAASLPTVLWFRFLFQLLATTLLLLPHRGLRLPRSRRPGLQLLRAALMVLSSALAFVSLKFMPVGEFTAIILMSPLFITFIAATRLGQQVSALRWALTFASLGGALIVIRPDAHGFTWATILPLLLVASNVGYQLLTSALAQSDDPGDTQIISGCIGALVMSAALPFFGTMPDPRAWMLFLALGFFGTLGHLLLLYGYRMAPVGLLAPFLYMQIAFAMLSGWIVFSHVPDGWAFAGVAIIAAAGMATTCIAGREKAGMNAQR
jgi:drug/metabolite transporter (DMT)-like permease